MAAMTADTARAGHLWLRVSVSSARPPHSKITTHRGGALLLSHSIVLRIESQDGGAHSPRPPTGDSWMLFLVRLERVSALWIPSSKARHLGCFYKRVAFASLFLDWSIADKSNVLPLVQMYVLVLGKAWLAWSTPGRGMLLSCRY